MSDFVFFYLKHRNKIMDIFTLIILVGFFYGVIFFFDSFFKSCMHYPYDAFLRGTGITVKFLRLKWHTTAFNRTIFRWGTSSISRLLSFSFNIGVYITILILPVALVILILSTFNNTESNYKSDNNSDKANLRDIRIELMLPGVNLPINEIVYYIAALAMSSIFHELGHAIAGVIEDVPVVGFGMHILLMISIAYTELGTDQLNSLKPWKKLKVLCAGIWHNILLAAICYLLFSLIPVVSQPFYDLNKSVVVKNINAKSPINGLRGLHTNDIITEINNCKVYNIDTWYSCLLESIKIQPSYCISTDFIHQNDESIPIIHNNDGSIECCDSKNQQTSCFEYIADNYYSESEVPQYMCLNVRKTIESSIGYCHKQTKCIQKDTICIKPLVNNSTTIIQMKRYNHGQKSYNDDMIYMGHPSDFIKTLDISEFVPKTNYLSSQIGDSIKLFLKYLIIFSLGLAIVNILPCFGSDGQHILNTILNQLLLKRVPNKNRRELIALCITIIGTLLLFINFVKAMWMSLYFKFR